MFQRKRKNKNIIFPTLENVISNFLTCEYSLTKDGITQSILSNFTCRVKFALTLARWRSPESGKNTYFGDMVHYILEKIYQRKKMPKFGRIRRWIDSYIDKKEQDLKIWTNDKIELAAGMVEIVMKYYCLYYKNDFKELVVLSTEENFNTPFHNAVLRGKRDLNFSYKKNSENWIMEHKTMGRVSDSVLKKRLPIDKQCLFYAIATEIEKGQTIDGVLFNIIRRPQLILKANEEVEDFLERLEIDIQERPEFYFMRYPLPYTKPDKLNFKGSLKHKLEEVQKVLNGTCKVYRNEDACESAYNGSPYVCEFISICSSGKIHGFIQQDTLFPELED